MGEIEQHGVQRALEVGETRSLGSVIFGAPRFAAAPVANSISVSEVDVSLSTVIELKLPCTDFDSIACNARRRSARR